MPQAARAASAVSLPNSDAAVQPEVRTFRAGPDLRPSLSRRPIVETEAAWRQRTQPPEPSGSAKVTASRWQVLDTQGRDLCAATAGDHHLVKIVLRTVDLSLSIDGKSVHDGVATPGMLHVSEPGALVRCRYRGPCDTLHLHVPDGLIAECVQDRPARPGRLVSTAHGMICDLATERLARTLLAAAQNDVALGPLVVDSVGIAIVARLLPGLGDQGGAGGRGGGLVKWRLRRTVDYVEAHLGEPIRLAHMAAAAGLTRMHFAAQFRASTGLRPHEYVLRRRIERAQEMLLVAGRPLLDIALAVGFQTQSHFTSTFARFAGQTPRAWRLAQGLGLDGPRRNPLIEDLAARAPGAEA